MKKNFKLKPILLATLIGIPLLQGCTTIKVEGNGETSVDKNQEKPSDNSSTNKSVKNPVKNKIKLNKDIRGQAVENAHYTHFFQESVINEYQKILDKVKIDEASLNEIFNFSKFIYNGNVLPPVVEESNDFMDKQTGKSLVSSKKRWKIIKDARVVITPPTWWDYFNQGLDLNATSIDPVLEPKNDREEAIVEKSKLQGEVDGRKYAQDLFKTNLAKLKHDYSGMMKWKKLRVQGVVDDPVLAVSKNPVIHSSDGRELIVGQKNYVITKDSQFQNSKNWNPVIGNKVYEKQKTVYSPPSYHINKEMESKQ